MLKKHNNEVRVQMVGICGRLRTQTVLCATVQMFDVCVMFDGRLRGSTC
jgi:hypothetical protein